MNEGIHQYDRYAFVALGSNFGDSQRNLLSAIEVLRQHSASPILQSSLWKTTPVECPPNSPLFLNAVIGLIPAGFKDALDFLHFLQRQEILFGRLPKKVLNEPRSLDLDLITYGLQCLNTLELILPHPRAHLRRFVLEPLCEIAPDLILPEQSETVERLLKKLPPDAQMRKMLDN
jgi:2-amino-4-hydroxy-6-hydroxymethyldihydropteridine diphosphokinase